MKELSDAEVLCGCMEARPTGPATFQVTFSPGGWWVVVDGHPHLPYAWVNVLENYDPLQRLGRLHLVEAKLTGAQRLEYWLELSSGGKPETGYWRILHASAETKLKALAAVLRGAGAAH